MTVMKGKLTDRERIGCEAISKAEMKTCLSFCQQLKPRMAIRSVQDKSGKNCSTAYLGLLGSLPSVWMSKDEVDIALDGSPQFLGVSILDISACAAIEVSHKISQDFDCRFVPRKSWYVAITDMIRGQTSWAEMKLPPGRMLALEHIGY